MNIVRDAKGCVSFGRWEFAVQALILLSLLDFSLETLPGLGPRAQRVLQLLEVVSVAIFSVEYLLRVLLSRPRTGYVFSFFGLVDLLSIVPSLLLLGWDLRTLRVIRLLRAFRILKLARYGPAIYRFQRAFRMVREELVLFGAVASVVLYLSAVGIYHFESQAQPEVFCSIFHSLWWATTTLTTVGYGDAYPITTGGRIFTFFVLVVGLGIVAVPTGLFASALTHARDEEEDKARQLERSHHHKPQGSPARTKSGDKRREASR